MQEEEADRLVLRIIFKMKKLMGKLVKPFLIEGISKILKLS